MVPPHLTPAQPTVPPHLTLMQSVVPHHLTLVQPAVLAHLTLVQPAVPEVNMADLEHPAARHGVVVDVEPVVMCEPRSSRG